MVWGGISLEGHTDLYRLGNGTLTAIRHWDEILGPVVRPYAAAVAPGFLLVHNNARPHVAGVCRQFLENKGIDAIDWPNGSPDLNLIEHLWDIMFQSTRRYQVALQTVQELSDALVQIWEEIPQDAIYHYGTHPPFERYGKGLHLLVYGKGGLSPEEKGLPCLENPVERTEVANRRFTEKSAVVARLKMRVSCELSQYRQLKTWKRLTRAQSADPQQLTQRGMARISVYDQTACHQETDSRITYICTVPTRLMMMRFLINCSGPYRRTKVGVKTQLS
ncbi:hypothetical protein NFI96_009927, partial [Prochilodus magdalenae]